MELLSIEEINRLAPYKVTRAKSPNTYRFMTDFDVDIAISFDVDEMLVSCESYQFNISNVNKKMSPRDSKIRDTVIAIIENFFERNQVALLYICETGDKKQAMRNRLFESWFVYANAQEKYTIMVANIEDEEGIENYAAVILRKDNPQFVEIVAEFTNTINMFRIKPDMLD